MSRSSSFESAGKRVKVIPPGSVSIGIHLTRAGVLLEVSSLGISDYAATQTHKNSRRLESPSLHHLTTRFETMRTLIVWLGFWPRILQGIGANGWRRRSLLPSLLLSGGGGECTDDVCSIGGPVAVALDQEVVGQSSLPPSGTPDAPDAPDAPELPDDIEERTAQLVKLGWPQEAATRALHESKYYLTEPANLLIP